MAHSRATRSSNALPVGRTGKSKASRGCDDAHPASDGIEESATQQADQVEDEEIAQEIKSTTSKLDELKNSDGGLDQWSRSFLKTLTADKDRVTVKLQEAKTAIVRDKTSYEGQLLLLLGTALEPVLPGVEPFEPIEPSRPLAIRQVTAEGQPLHQQSRVLLEESGALLETFNALLDAPTTSPLDKLAEEFNHGRNYTEILFAAGRRFGQSKVEDILADKYNEVGGRLSISKDEEDMGQLLFEQADRREEDEVMIDCEGWGKVAYKASRAAQKMEAVTLRS